MGILGTALIFIAILGLLVLVHEFGHFIVAKRSGVRVDEFGFGFPPRIAGKKWRGTLYSLNWIPLGGFVKIKGVAGDDPDVEGSAQDEDSFATLPFWRKFLILFAGIGMNLVLAAVLLSVALSIGVQQDPGTAAEQAIVTNQHVIVQRVLENTPAAEAGIEAGDVITAINGHGITDYTDVEAVLGSAAVGDTVTVTTEEDGDRAIQVATISYGDDEIVGIGIGMQNIATVRYPWYSSFWYGTVSTIKTTALIFVEFGKIVVNAFAKGEVSDDLSGPVGIAVLAGEVAQDGFVELLQFTAILSINLAIFNLLPLPALDGGRITFVLLEKLRRKPVDEKIEAVVHNVGFILLLLLVLLVTIRDVVGIL